MLSIGVEGLLEIAISPVGLITWEAIPDTGNNPKVVMTAIVRGDRTNLLVKSVFALSVRGGINTHLISFYGDMMPNKYWQAQSSRLYKRRI